MEEINILLYRNHSQKDWSVSVGGTMHNHVSTATLDELIDYASTAAQQNLLALEDPACVLLRQWGDTPIRFAVNQVPSTDQWGKEQLRRIRGSFLKCFRTNQQFDT
jgi:hypothetical protein